MGSDYPTTVSPCNVTSLMITDITADGVGRSGGPTRETALIVAEGPIEGNAGRRQKYVDAGLPVAGHGRPVDINSRMKPGGVFCPLRSVFEQRAHDVA